jgi:NTE family protein
MKKQLAFVLGGGGARGALQVGALRALLEAGYQPDMLVGTSAGAINATFLALRGVTLQSVDELVLAWHNARQADLIPQNVLWLTVRALFRRAGAQSPNRLKEFSIAQGIHPDLRFGDIKGVRLIIVAADLNTSGVALYGLDPEQSVLEGLLASTALPPWVTPIEKEGQLLMDGGVVSNLPIEPAMSAGATEIIALDLHDPRSLSQEMQGFGPFLAKLINTMEHRQMELELALAEARNVPLRYLRLGGPISIALWDFSQTEAMIQYGYEQTQRELSGWQPVHQAGLWTWWHKLAQGG